MRSVVPFFVSPFITPTFYTAYKIKTMKALKLIPFLSLLLLFAACGSDSDNDNGGSTNPQLVNNTNSNNADPNPNTHRLEFPHVKGGSSLIVTHYDKGEVNYSIEWDSVKRSCRWSCYEIYASNRETHTTRYYVSGNDRYSKQYPTDPDLHCSTAWQAGRNTDPFWGSGYDHGHLCPSADRLNSYNANYQTFYLSNMMPQNSEFNTGIWSNMESWVRNQINTKSRDTLFVVKGGTIDNADQYTVLRNHQGLIVPKYCFMAVLMKNASGYKAMGFWIENKSNNKDGLAQYVVNIDELERLTGIDFFCNLPDDTENHIESLPLDNVKRAWGF